MHDTKNLLRNEVVACFVTAFVIVVSVLVLVLVLVVEVVLVSFGRILFLVVALPSWMSPTSAIGVIGCCRTRWLRSLTGRLAK